MKIYNVNIARGTTDPGHLLQHTAIQTLHTKKRNIINKAGGKKRATPSGKKPASKTNKGKSGKALKK